MNNDRYESDLRAINEQIMDIESDEEI